MLLGSYSNFKRPLIELWGINKAWILNSIDLSWRVATLGL